VANALVPESRKIIGAIVERQVHRQLEAEKNSQHDAQVKHARASNMGAVRLRPYNAIHQLKRQYKHNVAQPHPLVLPEWRLEKVREANDANKVGAQ
jgi:hypothetical protein